MTPRGLKSKYQHQHSSDNGNITSLCVPRKPQTREEMEGRTDLLAPLPHRLGGVFHVNHPKCKVLDLC